ncbi:hypothetical protein EX30DRAFT_367266 [Ascodesmis nigricans]|uniref:Hydrophobin n=1 Tax=Ascodesmis nigricans TaxID=341454 RepID=A0A4S2MIK4_9PEZI|nr:hypothetical protein EX30DRAFT_367266 [Ascodesmis nigricans]
MHVATFSSLSTLLSLLSTTVSALPYADTAGDPGSEPPSALTCAENRGYLPKCCSYYVNIAAITDQITKDLQGLTLEGIIGGVGVCEHYQGPRTCEKSEACCTMQVAAGLHTGCYKPVEDGI